MENPARWTGRIRRILRWDELSPGVRKALAGIIGGLVLAAGLAMIFLPGPAFVVIPLGLAILATEFAWARHYLLRGRALWDKARRKGRADPIPPAASRVSPPASPPADRT